MPDCFESAVADTDRDTVPDQADPANIDACVPDPGFCPQVPIVGPAWQGMLTLRLAASGIALGRRWSCTLRGH